MTIFDDFQFIAHDLYILRKKKEILSTVEWIVWQISSIEFIDDS